MNEKQKIIKDREKRIKFKYSIKTMILNLKIHYINYDNHQ